MTERIQLELPEDQIAFLGRVRNLSGSEFIAALVAKAMREEWVVTHADGRVEAYNWEGPVADPSPATRRLMERATLPIKLALRPDVPAEWTDEIVAEMQRHGRDNPLEVCPALIREGLDRTNRGTVDAAGATLQPETAALYRWLRAQISGRMVGGEGPAGRRGAPGTLYDEELADADPADLAILMAFHEGTLRFVPTDPETERRLIEELDAVAEQTPSDTDEVPVVTTLRLPLGAYRAIGRFALAGNPKPADLMRRWVTEGLVRDAANAESIPLATTTRMTSELDGAVADYAQQGVDRDGDEGLSAYLSALVARDLAHRAERERTEHGAQTAGMRFSGPDQPHRRSDVDTVTDERQPGDRPDPDEAHTPGGAAARLAAALGWERLPVLTAEQERIADEKLAAAEAEADRIYGTANGA